MKKFISFLLILILSTCVFVACGENSTQQPNINTSSAQGEASSNSKASKITGISVDEEKTTSSTNDTSSLDDSSITISGSNVYIPTTPVPDDPTISDEVKMIIYQINLIESVTPENYKEKLPIIETTESAYMALSQADKALVTNYQDLVRARQAINELVAQGTIAEFLSNYATFDAVTTLGQSHVALVAQLKSTYESFTASQLEQIPEHSAKKTKIDNAYNSLKSQGFMEFYFRADDIHVSQSTFFIFSNQSPEENSTGQDKFQLKGTNPNKTVRFDFGETITFNTSIVGNLKIYCSNNDRQVILTHDDGTTFPENKVLLPDADDNNYREFTLTKAGNYTITLNEGELFIYAILLTA